MGTMKGPIAPAHLHQTLRYAAETGNLFWKARDVNWFIRRGIRNPKAMCEGWNTKFAGKEAFTPTGQTGYRQGMLNNRRYLAHRVIWAMCRGVWPSKHLDHINGDPLDNRIENLREADDSENGRNRGVQSNNRSGFKGVSRVRGCNKWQASIKLRGRHYHLGSFPTPEKASEAYCSAARKLHGEFAHIPTRRALEQDGGADV